MDERSGGRTGYPGQGGQRGQGQTGVEGRPPDAHGVWEASARVRNDVDDLQREGQELLGKLRSMVDEHPLAAVGMALGAGYVLSGALVSRTTLRLAALGARFYFGKVLSRRLGGLAASM